MKFIRLDRINLIKFMISCLKGSCDLALLHLENLFTRTRAVPSPFLISTALHLAFTRPSRNSSVFACSTACSIAAEMKTRNN